MKLLNRIKYRLLRWLLDDICCKSECEKCVLSHAITVGDYQGNACHEEDVFYQARTVWGSDE